MEDDAVARMRLALDETEQGSTLLVKVSWLATLVSLAGLELERATDAALGVHTPTEVANARGVSRQYMSRRRARGTAA